MTTILHATDFSAVARPAFRAAVARTRRQRARLHVLHVVEPPVAILEDSFLSARQWQRLEDDVLRAARRRLGRLPAHARDAGIATSATVLRSSVPADAIVRTARRVRADVIVVGTHGRSGLTRLALGSVAERVMPRARCPVLTVRGR